MGIARAKFSVGQLVNHKRFNYRGVIVDVDPIFHGTDEWYEQMALTRPPKDKPWYRVLVHNAVHETYVAERNLEADESKDPINHPMIDSYFDEFLDGTYVTHRPSN
ncbi:MAG: heat shock protein HspQ [Gammaproteobacteria bacterium]|nr:heat shock protein HspQ [Gammaproteobacteria bacterium]MCI0590587.1 heat shock protein HspQ [Gammaproteobacteria bacterium]